MKKLKPQKIDWAQIERFLQSAEKKLASAHKILALDEEALNFALPPCVLNTRPPAHVNVSWSQSPQGGIANHGCTSP